MQVVERTAETQPIVAIPADLIMNRVSYITRIIREIDSMDFSTPIIKAILNASDKPLQVNQSMVASTNNKVNKYESLSLDIYNNSVDVNKNISELNAVNLIATTHEFVEQMSFIGNVQTLSGPVGMIFRLVDGGGLVRSYPVSVELRHAKTIQDIYNHIKICVLDKIMERSDKLLAFGGNMSHICTKITEASVQIAQKSKRGRANLIIMHPYTYNKLLAYDKFSSVDEGAKRFTVQNVCDPITFEPRQYFADEMLQTDASIKGIPIRMSMHVPEGNIIIGYNSESSQVDGGITVVPYQICANNEQGFATARYSISDEGVENYFVVIKLVD